MYKILFIGDIVGSLGSTTVTKVLPDLKKSGNIALCLANGENLAHGRGASRRVVEQVTAAGVDLLTSGDHIFYNEDFKNEIDYLPVIRPANFSNSLPGNGYKVISLPQNGGRFLVINLLGTSYLTRGDDEARLNYKELSNPFTKVDEILANLSGEKFAGILVDFHAEATSEKTALGFYLDGRVSAVVGTHTHVPTADCRVLPKGTAYVTDVGMTGPQDSVLGVKKEIIINRFREQGRERFEWVEDGPAVLNAVKIEVDENTRRALKIRRTDRVILGGDEYEF